MNTPEKRKQIRREIEELRGEVDYVVKPEHIIELLDDIDTAEKAYAYAEVRAASLMKLYETYHDENIDLREKLAYKDEEIAKLMAPRAGTCPHKEACGYDFVCAERDSAIEEGVRLRAQKRWLAWELGRQARSDDKKKPLTETKYWQELAESVTIASSFVFSPAVSGKEDTSTDETAPNTTPEGKYAGRLPHDVRG